MVGGHLSDIRVLTKKATEIAAHRSDGIRTTPGKEMKQGFFFNGIAVVGNNLFIYKAYKGS
jgi:hypothetical protein